jgi:hypothetical protein
MATLWCVVCILYKYEVLADGNTIRGMKYRMSCVTGYPAAEIREMDPEIRRDG